MISKSIRYFLYLLSILGIICFYLSYFGLETQKFNDLIKNQILEKNKDINIELKSIKILLNLKKISFNLKTEKPKVIFNNKVIKLEEISTNFSLNSFFNKNYLIDEVKISTEELKLKNILSILRVYKDSPQLFIFEKMIQGGSIKADINLNFKPNGKINKDYEIQGFVKNTKIKLLNKKLIDNANFNFKIKKNEYILNSLNLEYSRLKLLSKIIKIKNKNDYFLVSGDIKNIKSDIKPELFFLLKDNLFKDINNLNLSSENLFSFKFNKKFKIKDFNLKSNIELNSLDYNLAQPKLKLFLPNFNNLIQFDNNKITLDYNNDKLSIVGKGNFSIDDESEIIEYELQKFHNDYNFKANINIKKNPIFFDFLNYKKEKNVDSMIKLDAFINNNNPISFKKILYEENNNKLLFNNLILNKDYQINSIKLINLDFTNNNKIKNKVIIKKKSNNYQLNGKIFDISLLLESALDDEKDNDLSKIFNNLNTYISFKINKTFLDKQSFVNNLNGSLTFKNNKISKLNLESEFPNKNRLTLSIHTNDRGEKITTLFSDYPKPLVKRYKFIKGFDEGILNFQSIKKNNKSKSVLVIDNFKVKEVPVLAKLLTLASLQGIADLLTGEGIRFTDFEMNFSKNGKLVTIDEIYAIGPAISIMMEGYIESKKLVSLRGTLVPATTINRSIASIPLLGDILIGKKEGEGVFGVSFKIKGPPKNLKTSVNPVKTLTPRFITRTLEKIKKN